MPDYLDIEPDQLRKMAAQHQQRADELRRWGKIPKEWLEEFPSGYGSIADQLHGALHDYYQRRHDNAERHAKAHENTRDQLLAAAAALENGDGAGGRQITHAGEDPAAGGTGPVGPVGPGESRARGHTRSDMPTTHETAPGPGAHRAPVAHHASAAPSGVGSSHPGASSAVAPGAPHTTFAFPPGSGSATVATSEATPLSRADSEALTGDPAAALPAASGASTESAPGVEGTPPSVGVPESPIAGSATTLTLGTGISAAAPTALRIGPLTAALGNVGVARGRPPLVVGATVDDDLSLARTVLAGVLAAVGPSQHGLGWAVGILRRPDGPMILLTSSEGRGWLPPGLFIPSEIVVPWRWDSVLGTAGMEAISTYEGIADPARILAEFGVRAGRRRRSVITALAASGRISDELRIALGAEVAFEENVTAAESEVDFSRPGKGLVDRLGSAGSDRARHQAEAVAQQDIWTVCLQLARAADELLARSGGRVGVFGDGQHAMRRQIIAALQSNSSIPEGWWDQLRAEYDKAAYPLRSVSVDTSTITLGRGRLDLPGAEALRRTVFQRRADEILLLIGCNEANSQMLRDVLYAHGQIVDHPRLSSAVGIDADVSAPGGRALPRIEADTRRLAGSVLADPLRATTEGAPVPSAAWEVSTGRPVANERR
ncbi:hypothetical protein IU429_27280 [Nocardia elegans]|nr:hypothetical protein [Nocardia elegans]